MKTGTSIRGAKSARGPVGKAAVGKAAAAKPAVSKPRRVSISELTAQRLSVYLRCLEDLARAGTRTISSQGLARALHLNSAQIRKDLACFGEFGVRGVGYVVADLRAHLTRILGLDRRRKIAIIGAGHLGMALADYAGFHGGGFSIAALFDSDPDKIGRKTRRGIAVTSIAALAEVARRERLSIAILAVPARAAQQVLDLVARAGIRAVLNFAPAPLAAPRGVTLKKVDLAMQLESLAFHLNRAEADA